MRNDDMRKPEDDFADLIEVYNSVPRTLDVMSFEKWLEWKGYPVELAALPPVGGISTEIGGLVCNMLFNFDKPGVAEEWLDTLLVYETLYDYVMCNSNTWFDVNRKLYVFMTAKPFFDGIVEARKKRLNDDPDPTFVPLPSSFLRITAKGISVEIPYVVETFKIADDHGHLNRIRSCEHCEKIFWARRSDAKYCSVKCLNNYNQKKYLQSDQTRERVNATRRTAYKSKKELKLAKGEKTNGTL